MNEKARLSEDLKSVIGFFTLVPVKTHRYPTARGLYFLSTLGLFLGLLAGLIFFAMSSYVGTVSAVIVYVVFITAISGFHHLDSVLDVGDALMARGDTDRMLRIMKDPATGAGGIGFFIAVYGILAAFALSIGAVQALSVLALAEATSKLSFLFSAYGRKPLGSSMGAHFIDSISGAGIPLLVANFAVPAIISLFLGIDYLITLVLAILIPAAITSYLEKRLSGINGDVIGFSGEISRMIYIFTFVVVSILAFHIGILGLKINI
ncbi:MAG: adenosylcobinamide-GDP ribazoletransferase [Thermoplasmatales archaeon B_DKE]|nr:MAG: adenosylcobinamide-GDP ribazoletransferase [Thermoplasmatales archaeon B_DKE]